MQDKKTLPEGFCTPPEDFSEEEKAIWLEICEAVKDTWYEKKAGDRLVCYEYVKVRIMRDRAMAAWNEKPERYVKIVTGISPDMKTPKIVIKENEHYAIMLDCNKQINKLLTDLRLTPKSR